MGRLAATQSRAATGGRDDWRTPAALLEAIERRWRIWLAVDAACSSENMVFTAATGFALDRGEDGLDLDWHSATMHDGGWVWCNPPYSRVADWMAKARHEAHIQGVRVVCLVPVRTDTGWWSASVHRPAHIPYGASRVTLLRGRVRFEHSTLPAAQSAPFPSCLIWYEPGHVGAPQYEVWDWRQPTHEAAP